MFAVDNIMKRFLGIIFALPFLFLFSCEVEEKPQLGELVIDRVTCDSVYCSVEVVSGDISEFGFHYATTKSAAEMSNAHKETGTFNGEILSAAIGGLQGNTLYYIRAYGMNSSGRTYTETISVRTSSRIPTMGDNDFPSMN